MQLLVWARTGGGPLQYEQGDIVDIRPDGAAWGNAEILPDFWQITVVALLDADRDTAVERVFALVNGRMAVTRRRKRFLDITKLSQLAQNNLAATGVTNITRLGFLAAITLKA